MQKIVWIFFLSLGVFGSSVFALDVCSLEFKPVCGAIQTTCTSSSCVYNDWTFANSCQLQKEKAIFLYEGSCQAEKSQPYLTSLAKKVVQTPSSSTPDHTSVTSMTESVSGISPTMQKMREMIMEKVEPFAPAQQIPYLEELEEKMQKQYESYLETDENKAAEYKILLERMETYITNLSTPNTETKNTNTATFDSLAIVAKLPAGWSYEFFDGGVVLISPLKERIILESTGKAASATNTSSCPSTSSNSSTTLPTLDSDEGFTPISVPSVPETRYEFDGEILGEGENVNMAFNRYLLYNVCQPKTVGNRTVAYQVLSKEQTHANLSLYSLMYVCQEWQRTNDGLKSLWLQGAPIKISVLQQDDGSYGVIEGQEVREDSNYIQDVKTIFPLGLHGLLLGSDIARYNQIIKSIREANQEIAESLFL